MRAPRIPHGGLEIDLSNSRGSGIYHTTHPAIALGELPVPVDGRLVWSRRLPFEERPFLPLMSWNGVELSWLLSTSYIALFWRSHIYEL